MATYYVDPSGAGGKDGSDWDNAFGLGEWETHLEGSAAAGDFYYVKGGTYTFTSNISTAKDGTATNPITIIGVNSGTTNEPPISSDWATGANRPLMAAAAYDFIFDNYWIIRNLRVTITDIYGLRADQGALIVNCNSNNSSGSAGRCGISTYGTDSCIINCESQSVNGFCSYVLQFDCKVIGCYLHDGETGIEGYADANYVFNIIDTMSGHGISFITSGPMMSTAIINNTIYNCGTGIEEDTGDRFMVMNNIISDCTTGIKWGTEQKSNYFDYNNYYNNTADVSNVTKGENATAYEPQYTGAAGGDFSLNTASDCIGAAFSIELGVG